MGLFSGIGNFFRKASTFSPLGLTGKAITGESFTAVPSNNALKAGGVAGLVAAGTVATGGLAGTALGAKATGIAATLKKITGKAAGIASVLNRPSTPPVAQPSFANGEARSSASQNQNAVGGISQNTLIVGAIGLVAVLILALKK